MEIGGFQGIICIVGSAIGIASLIKERQGRNRKLLKAFQILLIFLCFALWILVIVSAYYLGFFFSFLSLHTFDSVSIVKTAEPVWYTNGLVNVSLDGIIIGLAAIHVGLCMAMSCLLCASWRSCCPRPDRPKSKASKRLLPPGPSESGSRLINLNGSKGGDLIATSTTTKILSHIHTDWEGERYAKRLANGETLIVFRDETGRQMHYRPDPDCPQCQRVLLSYTP